MRGAELTAGHTDIASAAAFGADGRLIARLPADPAVVGQDFSTRDYFRGAIASDGAPFVSEAFASSAQDHPVLVAVAAPVRSGATLVGVVNMTVLPSQLVRELDALSTQAGRELLLLDAHSQVVASTAERTPLAAMSLAAAPTATATTADVDGAPRTYVSAAVPSTSWTLYVLDDPAVVYAAQRGLLQEIGGPLFVALLGAAVLAAIVAIGYLLIRRERDRLALANLQLVELNTTVEAATRAKSDFLASMSHELRTPLNAVLGFSDVLREQLTDVLTERQGRYLDNIHAAGTHLLELINDVLDLSKVEAGRLGLRPEPIPLSELLEPVVAAAAQLAADREVAFDPAPLPVGIVYVDVARVRQVLLNLLSNAVKFTRAGGVVGLRVSVNGTTMRAEVTDTGIGIPPEERGRVFGMFERLHEGRSEATGTGLGLAISKRLVELHGGTIDFASEPGHGTRFWFVLPDAIVEPEVGPRVLVVEDDTRDADLLAALVHEAGQRVEIAASEVRHVEQERSAVEAQIEEYQIEAGAAEERRSVLEAGAAAAQGSLAGLREAGDTGARLAAGREGRAGALGGGERGGGGGPGRPAAEDAGVGGAPRGA